MTLRTNGEFKIQYFLSEQGSATMHAQPGKAYLLQATAG